MATIASAANSAGLLVANTEMSPPQTVLFLIECLTSDEHAESLVKGLLRAKRLAHYKRREDGGADGRLTRGPWPGWGRGARTSRRRRCWRRRGGGRSGRAVGVRSSGLPG